MGWWGEACRGGDDINSSNISSNRFLKIVVVFFFLRGAAVQILGGLRCEQLCQAGPPDSCVKTEGGVRSGYSVGEGQRLGKYPLISQSGVKTSLQAAPLSHSALARPHEIFNRRC